MEPRNLLVFGTSIGMEIREKELDVVVARVRPSGVHVLGHLSIRNFRERPAAEWGAEYTRFLKSLGAGYLSATVLLPRRETIVRTLALPGVAAKDRSSAIAFQLDSLHPYGEDEVAWGWSPLRPDTVLIGITRRAILDRYLEMFAEAGVQVGSLTFSAAAIHSASRLFAPVPAAGFLAVNAPDGDALEVYGESDAKPAFSAEFDLPRERAVALAAAELRLPPETPALPLERMFPAPVVNPVENDLSRNALPYAAALAGACPRLSPAANLLPPERRASNRRRMFVPTAALAGLLLLVAAAVAAHSTLADRKYLQDLDREAAKIEPQAKRAAVVDRAIEQARNRARLLDEFRGRTRFDLAALNEITTLLPPTAWAASIELTRDAANITGETDHAAPLLKMLDASPYFEASEFSSLNRTPLAESFRIHSTREKQK